MNPSKLVNVPALSDVETINNVLTTLNADVKYKRTKMLLSLMQQRL